MASEKQIVMTAMKSSAEAQLKFFEREVDELNEKLEKFKTAEYKNIDKVEYVKALTSARAQANKDKRYWASKVDMFDNVIRQLDTDDSVDITRFLLKKQPKATRKSADKK